MKRGEVWVSFENVECVKFKHNLLSEVICQIRFPTILEIEKDVPSDFQNLISEQFPNANARLDMPESEGRFNVSPLSLSSSFSGIQQPRKNYWFSSDDDNCNVNLTRNFLSFSTRNYDCWKDFCVTMNFVVDSFVKIYGRRTLTRIGLRYINAVSKSALGLSENTLWSDLINIHLLGMMGDSKLSQNIKGMNSSMLLKCDNDISMQIQTGIFVRMDNTSDEVFLIDNDTFSTKKNTTDDVMSLLDSLHEEPRKFLHYAITEKLRSIMEPEVIC